MTTLDAYVECNGVILKLKSLVQVVLLPWTLSSGSCQSSYVPMFL